MACLALFSLLLFIHTCTAGPKGHPQRHPETFISALDINPPSRTSHKNVLYEELSSLVRTHTLTKISVSEAVGDALDKTLRDLTGFGGITCDLCTTAISLAQFLISSNSSSDEIKSQVLKVCISLKIETERVCRGIVESFAPELLTVLDKLILNPGAVCSTLFDDCGNPDNPLDNWNVTFPPTPQPPPMNHSIPKAGSPTLRVLHLTDIHYDSEYVEGGIAECGEPLCCREASPTPLNATEGAGKFGDYRDCDMPLWTLEHMFATLAAQNDTFDYVIWTGDVPPHNVWNQSRDDQLRTIQAVVDLFLKYLPGKMVYPSLGNHESSPVNSFPPPYITGENAIGWLYTALADTWKHWLPQDALDSVRRGAYYSVLVHPGLRVISLNMNYCNSQNWWMLLNTTDPTGELQWLIAELQKSEDAGEKVHILGHIPPGYTDCLKSWSWNYYRIVNRYQNTITGQFFGHTHTDEFEVFYDTATFKTPVDVAFIAPSVTTFSGLNMGYRFYTVDGVYNGSSYEVLDHETYYANLTKANSEGHITWEFEYSAKAAFNMPSTFPKDWDNLINAMKTDDFLLEKYNKFYSKSVNSGACDADCKKALLCSARTGRSHDKNLCQEFGGDTSSRRVKHC